MDSHAQLEPSPVPECFSNQWPRRVEIHLPGLTSLETVVAQFGCPLVIKHKYSKQSHIPSGNLT